jgi:hypothetical protein
MRRLNKHCRTGHSQADRQRNILKRPHFDFPYPIEICPTTLTTPPTNTTAMRHTESVDNFHTRYRVFIYFNGLPEFQPVVLTVTVKETDVFQEFRTRRRHVMSNAAKPNPKINKVPGSGISARFMSNDTDSKFAWPVPFETPAPQLTLEVATAVPP